MGLGRASAPCASAKSKATTKASRHFLLAAVVAFATGIAPPPAEGYVRTRSKSGTPVAWRLPQIHLKVVDPSESFQPSAEVFASTVETSAATWNNESIVCSDIHLMVDVDHRTSGVVRNDGVNTVLVIEHGWSHKLGAIALTTVFLRNVPKGPEDGEILDADIEINANRDPCDPAPICGYTWADIPDPPAPIRDFLNDEDLRNALVHEMGHLLGLWHNCHDVGEPSVPDDQGNPSPDCRDATLDMHAATMYPSTEFAAIDKRTLSDDELRAACEIYPYTYRLEGNGCAVAPTRRKGAIAGTLVAMAGVVTGLLAGRRRRSAG